MKPWLALAPFLLATSLAGTATAATLTPQECNSYPFVKTGHVTHAGLMQEIVDLESVGYRLNPSNPYYPADIEAAEHRLRVAYRHDCLHRPSGNGYAG